MKSFVFETENHNAYLYSPKVKKFIPIPLSTKECLQRGEYTENDNVATRLRELGYLEDAPISYSEKIESEDVRVALINVPQIVFEVTTGCNFKCKYCCYGELYETFASREAGNLDFNTAKILLDFISRESYSKHNHQINTPLVLSFYGGEPLLNFPIIERIVDYAKSLKFVGRFLRFSLTTNASLLKKHIDFFFENNFSLLISLDGDRQNNAYRVFANGSQAYDDVIENLEFVRNKYPDYFETIRFNAVFTNLSDTESVLNFFANKFGKTPTISPLHFNDSDKEIVGLNEMLKSISMLDPDGLEKFPDAFLEMPLHKKIVQMLMYMTDSLYYNEQSFIRAQGSRNTFPTHSCIPFTKRMFVTHNGKIVACEKVNRDKPLGCISNGKIQIDYNYIASYFNTLVYTYENQCKVCAMEAICNHCAFSSTSLKNCPDFKNYNSLQIIFSEIFSYLEQNPKVLKSIYDKIVLK